MTVDSRVSRSLARRQKAYLAHKRDAHFFDEGRFEDLGELNELMRNKLDLFKSISYNLTCQRG